MSIVDWVSDIVGISAPSTLEIIFLMSGFLGTAFFLILMTMMMELKVMEYGTVMAWTILQYQYVNLL